MDKILLSFVFKQKCEEIAKHTAFSIEFEGGRAILKKNNLELCIKPDYRDPKRMLIYGVYPETNEGEISNYARFTQVSASIKRPSISIAKQIKTHFLPKYIRTLNEFVLKVKKDKEEKKSLNQVLRLISTATGLPIVNRLNSEYRYIDFKTERCRQEVVHTKDNSIHIKLKNLTEEEAIKVVNAIKK